MSECVNNFLCYEDGLADGAVRALGKTGFSTGGSNSRVGNDGMSKCLTLGCAARAGLGCGAGSSRKSMTGCGNLGLCYEDGITDGAVRALGKTGSGTGGSNGRVGNNGVSECLTLGCAARAGLGCGTGGSRKLVNVLILAAAGDEGEENKHHYERNECQGTEKFHSLVFLSLFVYF